MLAFIRSSIFTLGYSLSVVAYGLFAALLFVFPPLTRHRIMLTWCSFIIFWVKVSCGIRYKIEGLENIKKASSPFVILSKHQSPWETFLLQIIFFPATTILKKELLSIPFFGWGLRFFRPIAIDRSNPRESLRQVKRGGLAGIKNGLNVLLFPEGTRVGPGERGKYARGGAEIAILAEADILPVAQNAGYCWPGKSFLKTPGLVTVMIGEPISTKDKNSREVTLEVEEWIESRMLKLTK